MTHRKVFRFRMKPNARSGKSLARMAGARRYVWNWALAQRNAHYRETGKGLPAAELSARLTALKQQPETAWLRDVDSQAMQQTLADLQRAYVNFFEKRARFPRFKSRKRDQARFRIPQRVRIADGTGVRSQGRLGWHSPVSAQWMAKPRARRSSGTLPATGMSRW